jgi:hypothetical protein
MSAYLHIHHRHRSTLDGTEGQPRSPEDGDNRHRLIRDVAAVLVLAALALIVLTTAP